MQWADLGSHIHNEELREEVCCYTPVTCPSPCPSIVLLHLHQLKDLEEVLQDLWGGQADLEQQVRVRGIRHWGSGDAVRVMGVHWGSGGAVRVRGIRWGSV